MDIAGELETTDHNTLHSPLVGGQRSLSLVQSSSFKISTSRGAGYGGKGVCMYDNRPNEFEMILQLPQ